MLNRCVPGPFPGGGGGAWVRGYIWTGSQWDRKVSSHARRSVLSIHDQHAFKIALDRIGSCLFKAFICHIAPACRVSGKGGHGHQKEMIVT